MRCYEITNKIVDGLPLICPKGEHPYMLLSPRGGLVSDGSARIPLAPALAQKVTAASHDGLFSVSRLMRCGIERTSELWLTPDYDESEGALVLFPSRLFFQRHTNVGSVDFTTNGKCVRLAECDFALDLTHWPELAEEIGYRSGRTVLAWLSPGASITAVEISEKKSWKHGVQQVSTPVVTVSLEASGNLDLHIHYKQLCEHFTIAAGMPEPRFIEKK